MFITYLFKNYQSENNLNMISSENDTDNQDFQEIINLNYLFNTIANEKEENEYLKSLKNFFNDFFSISSALYNRFNELYDKFFYEKHNFVINSPIYKLDYAIKKILKIHLNFLKSMVSNSDIISSIQNNIDKLCYTIKNLPSKINKISVKNNSIDESTHLTDSLNLLLKNLEMKIIDEYVSKKYNKHILGVNNKDTIENLVISIRYLENSLLNILKERKVQYFDDLKLHENKINKSFDEINKILENYISYIKDSVKIFKDEITNLENEKKSMNMNKEKDTGDTYTLSKNEFIMKDSEINRLKYKIHIIKFPKINLLIPDENKEKNKNEEQNNETKNNKENNDDLKSSKFKERSLYLNERDIYEIISKLYSYNFFILDTSQYDLNIAKGKVESFDLSNQLLSYLEKGEDKQKMLENNYDELIKSIDEKILSNIENTKIFFVILNNFRSKAKNLFSPKLYDIIIYIYNKTLDYLLVNSDNNLEDLMIILSQTYYKIIEGQKVYLCQNIKSHEIYKRKDFWERNIINKIEEEFNLRKKISKNINVKLAKEKIEESILAKLLPFENIMIEFNFPKNQIIEILELVFKKYECGENIKEQALSFLNASVNYS